MFEMMPLLMKQVMTPAIVGNPGSHYVCFVVNLKSKKFELLNSLMMAPGEKLNHKNGEPTIYKKCLMCGFARLNHF
jgi:hypothetical protein